MAPSLTVSTLAAIIATANAAESFNCCGGGSACGFVHCPAVGAGMAGCVRPWAMPAGMTMETCQAPQAVVDYAPGGPGWSTGGLEVMPPGLVVDPMPDTSGVGAPEGCLNYNDGCNTCSRTDTTSPMSCTEMMCFMQGTPVCNTFAAGYGGSKATDSTVGGVCALGFCEDPSQCPQCNAGMTCVAQAGMMCAGTYFGTCAFNSDGH